MILLLITATFHAPWCESLKDKRALIKPLMHQLRTRFNLAVAESGLQDDRTRAEISLALLAFHAAQAESLQQTLYEYLLGATEAELQDWQVEYR